MALVPPGLPTPLLLAQLAGELGSFPGILNVLCGPASMWPVLASQPGVQKVAFCGAVEVSSGLEVGWAWLRAKRRPAITETHGVPSGRTCSATDPSRQWSQPGPGPGHRVTIATDGLSRCGLRCGGCCRCCLVRPQPGEICVLMSPKSRGLPYLSKYLETFPACFYFLFFGTFYYLRRGLM